MGFFFFVLLNIKNIDDLVETKKEPIRVAIYFLCLILPFLVSKGSTIHPENLRRGLSGRLNVNLVFTFILERQDAN